MNFTQWRIDKLRRGLIAYRLMKASNGRPLPWKSVLDHILHSEKTAHDPPRHGKEEGEFKQEALRRFANGQNSLMHDKLEDVWLFLVEKHVLGRNELEESGGQDLMSEAAQIHARLASESEEALAKLRLLASEYCLTRNMPDGSEEIVLSFMPQPRASLLAATERVRVIRSAGTSSYERKDRGVAGSFDFKGYAFMAHGFPTLHVFLRGPASADFIHYVRVGSLDAWQLPSLTMVRTGDAPVRAVAGTEQEQLLARYNIVQFSPVQSAVNANPQVPSRSRKVMMTKVQKVGGVRT